MSEMAKIVQQQHLKKNKLGIFFQIRKDRLSGCLKLSVSNKRTLLLTRGKKITSEVTRYYYAVARGRRFDSFEIYADVSKFLFEVNGVVGLLYKVCESYSEAHL
jgi:hypothetical protein